MPDVTPLRPSDPSHIGGYDVLGRLGTGGQGVVYLGQAPDGRRVAVKQLHTDQADERAHERLVKEVAAARRVAPFCTAPILDADLEGPMPYVVTEYIDGPSLQRRVRREGPLTGSALHWMAIGTATALAAIHQAGIVHRDFKPANVMLAADGPRVIDFGIARDLSADTTVTSRVIGTPAYMAPEQIRGEPVGSAADLFAWASVIAYAATGKAPFEAEHVVAVATRITSGAPDLAGVPDDVAGVLRRCLAQQPAERPTAYQVVSLLLGRPGPEPDPADRAGMLATAARLVQADSAQGDSAQAESAQAESTPTRPAKALPTRPESAPTDPIRDGLLGRPPLPDGQDAEPTVVRTTNRPGPKTRRREGILAGAGAVVLILGLAAWIVARGGFGGAHPDAAAGRPASTAAAVPLPAAAPTGQATTTVLAPVTPSLSDATPGPPGTVPSAFAGTWNGPAHAVGVAALSWHVRIGLASGAGHGTLALPELGCSGTVSVQQVTSRKLTLAARIDDDANGACSDQGTIGLTLLDAGRVSYAWQDVTGVSEDAAGVLTRE